VKRPSQFWRKAGESAHNDIYGKEEEQRNEPPGLIEFGELESDQNICNLSVSVRILCWTAMLRDKCTQNGSDSNKDQKEYGQFD
jgi:hypothetical protein